jgi:hypothetical protein
MGESIDFHLGDRVARVHRHRGRYQLQISGHGLEANHFLSGDDLRELRDWINVEIGDDRLEVAAAALKAETAYTKGPWLVCDKAYNSRGIRAGIYHVGEAWDCNSNPENEANARLIAAAPDLVEALMQCRAMFDDDENIRQVIDAALSRALGKEG